MKSSRFVWGVTLILLGLLWLGTQLGYLSMVVWPRLLTLWPLFVVFLGLRIILKDGRLLAFTGLIMVLVAFSYAAYSPMDASEWFFGKTAIVTHSETLKRESTDRSLVVTLETGAAEVTLSELNDEESRNTLFTIQTEGIERVSTTRTTNDSRVNLLVTEKQRGSVVLSHGQRKIVIKTARNIPLSLILNTGASKTTLDASRLNLTDITAKSGASSLDLRVGSLETLVGINVQSGASDYTVWVPADSGYRVESRSGLSNVEYPSGSSAVVGNDTRESSNYLTATRKVNLTVESGLTNLKLKTY